MQSQDALVARLARTSRQGPFLPSAMVVQRTLLLRRSKQVAFSAVSGSALNNAERATRAYKTELSVQRSIPTEYRVYRSGVGA